MVSAGRAGVPSPFPRLPAGGLPQVVSAVVSGAPHVVSGGVPVVRVGTVTAAVASPRPATRSRMRRVTAWCLSVVVVWTVTGRRPGFLVHRILLRIPEPVCGFWQLAARGVGRMRCASAGGRPVDNLP